MGDNISSEIRDKNGGLIMRKELSLNMFRIRNEVIPEYAYKYKILKVFESEEEKQKYVKGKGGIFIDGESQTFLTLIQQNENDDLKMIDKISFKSNFLKSYEKEALLRGYLKHEKRIDKLMESQLNKIRKPLEIGEYVIWPYLKSFQVKIVKDTIYLVVDFTHTITPTKSLWDYIDRDPEKLHKYIGKEIKFELNKTNTYEIVKIEPPEQDVIDSVIRYIIYEKGYVKNIQELEAKFGKIDYNQPIMYCRFKSNKKELPYPFLPQLSYLVFSMEELEGTDEIKEIQNYWTFTNEERIKVIQEIAKAIDGIIDVNPAKFEGEKLTSCILLAKGQDGDEMHIKETNRLFAWLNNNNSPIYLPYEIPDSIKGIKIPTFILVDDEVKNKKDLLDKVIKIFKKYNIIAKKSSNLPYFDFSSRVFYFNRKNPYEIVEIIRRDKELADSKSKISFALIVGKEKYKEDDYYLILKKRLFNYRIISQNVIGETTSNQYAINNLLIQIMAKIGIKYFVLNRKTPYDYILGIDVGKGEFGTHRIAGVTVVFDSTGKISKIIPYSVPSPGETANIPRIIYDLYDRHLLDFENKNVLILRDGRLIQRERHNLKDLSSKIKAKFTYMNVVKNHIYRIGSNEYGMATILDDIALLLPHTTNRGSKPVKITQKYIYDGGEEKQEIITLEDLQLLYDLTRLNYSRLYRESLSMKLPAPIHYADKFIKAIQKGWELDEELLKMGCLYFI